MAERHNQSSASGESSVDSRLVRHGGLTYLEIPAADAQKSAAFYEQVLGWRIDQRSADDFRFEDATGHLIGRWLADRAVSRTPGLLPYYYVERVDEALRRVGAHGGEVIKTPYAEGDLWVATVRDPAGNMLGLWQAGPR